MSVVKILAQRLQLPGLEFSHLHAAPRVASSNQRGVHQLQYGTLTESMWNRFGAPALLAEEPLEQVRGSRHLAMCQRQLLMRDAGVEVLANAEMRPRPNV